MFRGVYLLGHPVPPPGARELGAVIACGDDAVLSHRSAAVLWRLLAPRDEPVHVTVSGRARRNRRGIAVHRARLHPRDRTRRFDIPVTTPARTLLDIAEGVPAREFERAWDEAHVERLVRPGEMSTLLERTPGRHGARLVRALLSRDSGPALTKREAEERLLALVRAADLPPPRVNSRIGPYEVDFYWPEYGLVIEVDSWQYHAKSKFESDRERDDYLQGRKLRVMRVTWRWIVDRPEALVARIAAALAAAGRP